jgi:hypothetical protein
MDPISKLIFYPLQPLKFNANPMPVPQKSLKNLCNPRPKMLPCFCHKLPTVGQDKAGAQALNCCAIAGNILKYPD